MLAVVGDRVTAESAPFVLHQFRPAYGPAAFLLLTGAPHSIVNERSAEFTGSGALPTVTTGSLVVPALCIADCLAEVHPSPTSPYRSSFLYSLLLGIARA